MSRFLNLVAFLMLSICIYVTFSVKDDVADLATKVVYLKKEIRQEQEKIDIYQAEWASLTGAENIEKLKNALMPHLKIVSVDQMYLADEYTSEAKFAQVHTSSRSRF